MRVDAVDQLLSNLGLNVIEYNERSGEFRVICPFHDDKNASLFVNPHKEVHICFANCTKGSIQKLVKKLTGKYLPIGEENKPEITYWDIEASLYPHEKMEIMPDWDYVNLFPVATNNKYLIGRGLTNKTIELFDLRYCKPKKSIIIPVWDGATFLGHIWRRTESIEKGYSKGFPLSSLFYSLNHLDLTQKKSIILVEGSFDYLRLYQLGFCNTLAVLGTNLSRQKTKRLLCLTRKVIICFDNDFAGKQGTIKTVETLEKKGIDTYVVTLPSHVEDVDELPDSEIRKLFEGVV